MSIKKINIPKFQQRAEIRANSYDKEKRTVEVVFSTGARGLRGGFFSEPYYEELEISEKAMRMDRLNSGAAPVLNSHNQFDLNSVIGVVESAEIRDGKAFAKVRFSDREDVKPIVKDVEDGILKNISFGYRVYKYEEMEERQDDYKVFRAVDFEPMELSFVAVPFDSGAMVRSNEDKFECEILTNERSAMEDEKKTEETVVEAPKTEEAPAVEEKKDDEAAAVESEEKKEEAPASEGQTSASEIETRAIAAERKRFSEINSAVRKAGLKKEVADSFFEKGLKIDEVRKEILDMLSKETNKDATRSAHIEMGQDLSRAARIEGCTEAVLHRANSKKYTLSEKSNQFRYYKMLDVAAECLRNAGTSEFDLKRMNPSDLADRAFHSTSDFPLILENIVNKSLRDGYELAPRTFTPFVTQRPVADFKTVSSVQAGMGPELLPVAEGGELQAGTIEEGAEKGALESYGRKVRVTRRVIINDDLNALANVPFKMGVQQGNLESKLFWEDIVIGNPTMADGYALFSTQHANLAGAGAAIDVTTLSAGRQAMLSHKDIDGTTPIVVMPEYIAVAPEMLTVAEQYTTVLQGNAYSPTSGSNQNPFLGKLTPIVEPRLAQATQPWFLLASAGRIPMVEWLVLQGQEGGPISSQYLDNETKGITFDILYDVKFLVVDYRGFYKNPGV